MTKIMVLGADGYLGWPTSLYWMEKSEVILIDNYIKRKINSRFKRSPLINLQKPEKKLNILEISSIKISFSIILIVLIIMNLKKFL